MSKTSTYVSKEERAYQSIQAPLSPRHYVDLSNIEKITPKENNNFQCTVIYDSRKHQLDLKEGFGFSCFIKFKDMRILFDTGGDQKSFFHNMNKLNIPLDNITHVVFSHQHWDHTAGFEEVLKKVAPTTKVYVPHKFSSSLKKKIPEHLEVQTINDFQQIAEDCYSLVLKGSSMVLKECFSVFEQSLVFNGPEGLIVLTGCGHPGVGKILRRAMEEIPKPIDALIGGFHLHHSFGSTINSIVEDVISLGIKKIAPCHCTGEKAIAKFQETYHENCHVLGIGSMFEVNSHENEYHSEIPISKL